MTSTTQSPVLSITMRVWTASNFDEDTIPAQKLADELRDFDKRYAHAQAKARAAALRDESAESKAQAAAEIPTMWLQINGALGSDNRSALEYVGKLVRGPVPLVPVY